MADELNFQIPQQGFDSYLYGIIPDDQAVLAGAFSVSMQQVRNIDKIDIEQFAQVRLWRISAQSRSWKLA